MNGPIFGLLEETRSRERPHGPLAMKGIKPGTVSQCGWMDMIKDFIMFVMSVSRGENERLKMPQRSNQHMFSCLQETLDNENKGPEPKFAVQNNSLI